MTDISESGIEAAAKAIFDTWAAIKGSDMSWAEAIAAADRPNVYPEMAAIVPLCRAEAKSAIQAYLPFHPPASREEGLRVKALEWKDRGVWATADCLIGRYEIDDVNGLWHTLGPGGFVSRGHASIPDAKTAAQEHYTNAILCAIETESKKPE